MQNVMSKKICLSERQSPKGHYWWVFQCFMKVWDKSAEQFPPLQSGTGVYLCVGAPRSLGENSDGQDNYSWIALEGQVL